MKDRKLFIILVLVVVICVVMAGCGSSPSSGNEGRYDTNKTDNQEWSDPEKPEDQDWNDPENPEDQDWRDPENPEVESTDPSESDQTGMYRHEIDGIVFYTEHDVEQWIGHQDGLGMTFDLAQMVKDLFGDDAISGYNAAHIPWHEFTLPIVFENRHRSAVTGIIEYDVPTTQYQAKEGYYPYFAGVYDLGDGSEDYYKPFYYINGSYYCTDYELIEVAVYACERWAAGEYYNFENFDESSRLLIVDGGAPRNP